MEITKESIGHLNEKISIRLSPDDYQQQLDSSIKKTKKKVNMPGFRPGHVPEGLVRKVYGKSLLVDELNRIVSESLEKYIQDSKLSILGQPLPVRDGNANNFDTPGDFEFSFELGLSPDIKLDLPPAHEFPFYVIRVEPDKVDLQIEAMRKRHGEMTNPEQSDKDCIIDAVITEVDDTGKPVENGISKNNTILVEKASNEEGLALLTGLKVGEVKVIDIKSVFDGTEAAYVLGRSPEELEKVKNRFEIKVESIRKVEKAVLDQSFFDKVYGPGTVDGEQAFREKVEGEIAGMYRTESERKLAHDIEDELLRSAAVELPDSFLKRWLREANEKPVSADDVEKEYGNYARRMKWKLIEGRIVAAQKIEVTQDEIKNYGRHYVARQLAQYGGGSGLTGELIDQMASRFLEKEENTRHAYEAVTERKVFEYLTGMVKRQEKEVSYDEFAKIIKEHSHEH